MKNTTNKVLAAIAVTALLLLLLLSWVDKAHADALELRSFGKLEVQGTMQVPQSSENQNIHTVGNQDIQVIGRGQTY